MNWTVHAGTDVGCVREQNEDAYLVDDGLGLAVIADGMGGHACGEVASNMAVTLFRDGIEYARGTLDAYDSSADRNATAVRAVLRDAMRRCCRAVYEEAQRDPGKSGMGTTCSALVVTGGTAFVAHVGDSRVYRIRDQRIVQVTRDHSLLEQLVAEGQLTAAEAKSQAYACYRSALARAIGVEQDVEVDVIAVEALPGDVFLLASDGLTRYLHEEEIAAEIVDDEEHIDRRLIDIANARGGADNVTVIVVQLAPTAREATGPIKLDDTVRALRRSAIFRALSYADILHILSVARTSVLAEGVVALSSDHTDGSVYAVLSGSVRVDIDGLPSTVLGPGEPFGEFSLAHGGGHGRIVAAEHSRVMQLVREDLVEIARKSPEVGDRLLATMSRAS